MINATITIGTSREDTARGYHNRESIITFRYAENEPRYSPILEVEIVNAITENKPGHWMWYYDKGVERSKDGLTVKYHRSFGYDSGD